MDYNIVRSLIPGVTGLVVHLSGRWHAFSDMVVSLTAAINFMITLLTGTLGGVECSASVPGMKSFVNALCSKMPSLRVPYYCWRQPHRVHMFAAKVSPANFGSFDCMWDPKELGQQLRTTSTGPISTNRLEREKRLFEARIRKTQWEVDYW